MQQVAAMFYPQILNGVVLDRYLWALRRLVTTLPLYQAHGHWVRSLRLTPNGRMLLSGSGDSTIGLWEVNSEGTDARLIKLLSGHTNRVRCVRASHDGTLFFSGSCDMTVRCWELSS
jgi:WD40 repeat protein